MLKCLVFWVEVIFIEGLLLKEKFGVYFVIYCENVWLC